MSEPPLRLQERESIGKTHNVYFDGQFIVIETVTGKQCVLISPEMMALLFWFNRRVTDTFPHEWAIDLAKLEEDCSNDGTPMQ